MCPMDWGALKEIVGMIVVGAVAGIFFWRLFS